MMRISFARLVGILALLHLCGSLRLSNHIFRKSWTHRLYPLNAAQNARRAREAPVQEHYVSRTQVGKKYKELISSNSGEAIELLNKFVGSRDYVGFAKDLKTLASISEEEVSPHVIDSIYTSVNAVLDYINGAGLADVVWSLGKLSTRDSNRKYRACNALLRMRFLAVPNPSSRQVTTSLGGFAKLGMRWEELTAAEQEQFNAMLALVASSLNEREVGNLLHSLSRIGITWAQLSVPAQSKLLASLLRQASRMKAEHGAMTVYALGILGLSFEQLSAEERRCIDRMSHALLQDVLQKPPLRNRFQQASNVIYGLAKMGAQFSTCSAELQESIWGTLRGPVLSMNAQEVSNTVYSICILGMRWASIPGDVRVSLESAMAAQASYMITQGLSTTLYGLGMMGTPWLTLSKNAQQALYRAIVRCFTVGSIVPALNGQAVANGIYALGFCEVSWEEFPEDVRAALMNAVRLCGPYLKPQEAANLIYGLGMLRTKYDSLAEESKAALAQVFVRLSGEILEQELCSCLHGLAKMEARWDDLPRAVQRAVFSCITRLVSMNSVCLGCTIYSLGMLGARWESLPPEIAQHIVRTARARPLVDQTLSNALYGMSLMGAEWDSMDAALRETLLSNLAHPEAFRGDNPQHMSNSLWSLGKMDATWLQLPGDSLAAALLRCMDRLSRQELANAIYGLAIVDVPWSALSLEVIKALEKAILVHIGQMTVQETANLMYSLALMTFDFYSPDELVCIGQADAPATDPMKPPRKTSRKKVDTTPELQQTPTAQRDYEARREALWSINEAVQRAYAAKDESQFVRENYDQFAIYFELMRMLKEGNALAKRIFDAPPRPSGPSATVPSKMHASTVHAMMNALHDVSPDFECVNEFNGLQGVFPVDAAVYFKGSLVALVEVDGEFHYKQLGQQLRRKDHLKEFLYRCEYPRIPLYRMRADQLQVIGFPRAGEALANWICKDLTLGEKKTK